jgi:hypothetical protein
MAAALGMATASRAIGHASAGRPSLCVSEASRVGRPARMQESGAGFARELARLMRSSGHKLSYACSWMLLRTCCTAATVAGERAR